MAVAVTAPAAAAQTANFGWAQQTLSTNFGQVLNVAVDASGPLLSRFVSVPTALDESGRTKRAANRPASSPL
jgi:hypothetical protein